MTPENLNPQIRTTKIGVRVLREITIYPLSTADELRLDELISSVVREALGKLGEGEDQPPEDQADESKERDDLDLLANIKKLGDKDFVGYFVNLIKTNIVKFFNLITDDLDGEDPLKEITNLQLVEIADIVFAVNFEAPAKNVLSLFDRARNLSASRRPLPESVENTGTDSKISSESPSETEESPEAS